ncbi:MAG: undecaprenyl-phosphate glucose phosphotransferase [Hyphomicrobium sp.]
MSDILDKGLERASFSPMRLVLGGLMFSGLVVTCETSAITGASLLTGITYHNWVYGTPGDVSHYLSVGGITALLYTLPFLLRDDYRVHKILEEPRSVGRVFLVWNYVFFCLALIGFVTKTTEAFSRGSLLLFYAGGLATLLLLGILTRRGLRALLSADRIERRRLMIVGSASELNRIEADAGAIKADIRIAASVALPFLDTSTNNLASEAYADSLKAAVSQARALHIDDVVIFTDWSRANEIQSIVSAFQDLPVGIHVGASNLIGPFTDARISRFASMPAVSLTAPPLGLLQMFMKRALDTVASALALLLLSPVFVAVALLIKATSPGPVFFRQRRRGYNHREFRIWKFRTMTTMDDGNRIEQASKYDARVTWIGRILRRTSIDELPQLFNVLAGDMSLVGPRPHAVAHDQIFEQRIAAYARRLNVRPGITGWAQVNGCRGATSTDEAMRRRVDHDLYYIDNWSIALDLYIISLTVLSPKTFRNAH